MAVCENTWLVSRTMTPVATATGWPPTEAMVVMSAVSPPAPLGSMALKHITHMGWASVAVGVSGEGGAVGTAGG